jgi:Flp pilus assembly pilin Flp
MLTEVAVLWSALRADRRAITALEYGLIVSMVAVVITMTVDMLGRHLLRVFDTIATAL